jgi:Cft2 family RNA processing exonuclease
MGVLMDPEPFDVSAQAKIFEFSAHADQPGLLRFVSRLNGLEKVIVLHGEDPKPTQLAKRIEKMMTGVEAFAPKPNEGEIEV